MIATPFSRVLIANRGEIALRIIRTARRLGIGTVAVYSEADAGERHVLEADEAVLIGEAAPKRSYLDIARVIDAARLSGADAVHPGYGFLSENAAFAQACCDAGLVFIGPSPDSIRRMGDKALAKQEMEAVGLPCIPGYSGEDQTTAERLLGEAERIGWPVMIKAVSGGGGRGMRLVAEARDFTDNLRSARAEADSAFGDSRILLEKAILRPRHIEIQIFGDRHGKVIHLGERDCSVQRRHQKLVEEAPSPFVGPELRHRMGEAAVAAARSIGYEGAGTLEFLVDADGAFWFMEMNTRLQVEHPVTEAITGLDLVELQLRVAAGEPLPLDQDSIAFTGHAIELRLCAEDPARDFLPQTGEIARWRMPNGIRVDDALRTGSVVSPWYDSMVAKLVAHGETRDEARRRLLAALDETVVHGVVTNRAFLAAILGDEEFAAGEATTSFLPDRGSALASAGSELSVETIALCAALLRLPHSPVGLRPHTLGHAFSAPLRIEIDGRLLDPEMTMLEGGVVKVVAGDDIAEIRVDMLPDGDLRFECGGRIRRATVTGGRDGLHVTVDGVDHFCRDLTYLPEAGPAEREGDGLLRAAIAGQVTAVHVAEGASVSAGQVLVTLEAMKMEHEHALKADGRIAELLVGPGDQVTAGQVLLRVEAETAT